jgi:hypothetical protein
MTGPTLLITSDSRAWRRQLGPLAWAALEHLALAAQPGEAGWAAPVGVRDVAGGLGVTKDTAARAVTALTAAGLVTLTRIETGDGRSRSGYRLHLPAGIEARPCPGDADTASQQEKPSRCPNNQDNRRRPADQDSASDAIVAIGGRERDGAKQVRSQPKRHGPAAATSISQPALFDVDDARILSSCDARKVRGCRG